MRGKSFLLVAGFLGALVLIFSLAYAQPPRSDFRQMPDELGLTDEQIEKIKDIQFNFKKTQIGLRADLKTSRLELKHLLMHKKPNQKEISKLVDKIAETQKQLLKHNVDRKLAMKEILTQEQFEKFIEMREKRGREGMGRGEKFRPHRSHEFCPHGNGPGF